MDQDYLMKDFMEISKHKGSKTLKPSYRKGPHNKFEWEMMMVRRKHQEVFKFMLLDLKKGFRTVTDPCSIEQRKCGIKRKRKKKN